MRTLPLSWNGMAVSPSRFAVTRLDRPRARPGVLSLDPRMSGRLLIRSLTRFSYPLNPVPVLGSPSLRWPILAPPPPAGLEARPTFSIETDLPMKQQANLIRAGQVIEHDGNRWTALKQQIITPGKGGVFIQ